MTRPVRARLPRPRARYRPSPGQMQFVLLTLIRPDGPPMQVLEGGLNRAPHRPEPAARRLGRAA